MALAQKGANGRERLMRPAGIELHGSKQMVEAFRLAAPAAQQADHEMSPAEFRRERQGAKRQRRRAVGIVHDRLGAVETGGGLLQRAAGHSIDAPPFGAQIGEFSGETLELLAPPGRRFDDFSVGRLVRAGLALRGGKVHGRVSRAAAIL